MAKDVQKYTKNAQQWGQNWSQKSRLYYRVLLMFMEALGQVTHLVPSQSGQKCAKIHKECTKIWRKLVRSDPKRKGNVLKCIRHTLNDIE